MISQQKIIELTARVAVDMEAACHMRVGCRLSASTAEGAARDGVPRLGILKIVQVALEVVRETMALPYSLIARFKPGPVVGNGLGLRDNGGTISGINVFDGSFGVVLEPLSEMNEERLRFFREVIARDCG
jgi:hypothetical protein